MKTIKSVAGTNRYGSLGAFGAIIIKTEGSSPKLIEAEKAKPSALAKGNDYIEEAITVFEINKEGSNVPMLIGFGQQAGEFYKKVK